jgi:tRNA(adenine34) deaminase
MTNSASEHEAFMGRALELAVCAYALGEIPIGAVVVQNGMIVGEGYNRSIIDRDPSAHAEMVAIRQAAQRLANYRLIDCTLYVTVEPCTMCTGLLVHARIQKLVFGAAEPKAGAVQSAMKIGELSHLNHNFEVQGGILDTQCAELMSRFFKERRQQHSLLKKSALKQND